MKEFRVYRTPKGNLTIKGTYDTVIYTIHSTTEKGANEMLTMLKAHEKRTNKKIED